MTSLAAVPSTWRVSEGGAVPLVPLIDVQRTANVKAGIVNYAVKNGVITVADQGGVGRTRRITLEDALLVLAAAALAAAVGVAFVSTLRALRAGGTLAVADTPGSVKLTIPLPVSIPVAA